MTPRGELPSSIRADFPAVYFEWTRDSLGCVCKLQPATTAQDMPASEQALDKQENELAQTWRSDSQVLVVMEDEMTSPSAEPLGSGNCPSSAASLR